MRPIAFVFLSLTLIGCESLYREAVIYGDEDTVPVVYAKVETIPVASKDDAADDPAIWYNQADPARSLVLGTDKQAGLGIYTLDGKLKQFIPAGLLNNIDIRQHITVGTWSGDLAAASNRRGDVVTLFALNADGGKVIGSFPAGLLEPYGSCMGVVSGRVVVLVTYKTGEVRVHLLQDINEKKVEQRLIGTLSFDSQLEGCVLDDATGSLYIGEEDRGLWRTQVSVVDNNLRHTPPQLVDEVDGASGITADVEGVALYKSAEHNYVVASSQGNDSYAVYTHANNNKFVGRFRVGNNVDSGIDGSQETDGLEVDSRSFGPEYPLGILIVQDGYNAPVGEAQNFKIIDWRDIAKALGLHE